MLFLQVVGHDIGGGIARLLALRARNRVTGLVLASSIAYDSFPEPAKHHVLRA